jgi:hypothetical protein
MSRALIVLLASFAGFCIAAVGGCAAVDLFSTANAQDKALESSVVSLLLFGPVGFFAGGVWAFYNRKRAQRL